MSEVKPPNLEFSSLEQGLFKFLERRILEVEETISYKHLKKKLVAKFGMQVVNEHKAKIKQKITSYVKAISKQSPVPPTPSPASTPKTIDRVDYSSAAVAAVAATAATANHYPRHTKGHSKSQMLLPTSSLEDDAIVQRAQQLHTYNSQLAIVANKNKATIRQTVSLGHASPSHPMSAGTKETETFQQFKVKKMLFKKKGKDGVLFCRDLPSELSAPDRKCVGCAPCHGNLLKRHGIFWTPHEFELRNMYIVHRLADDASPTKASRAKARIKAKKSKGKAEDKRNSKSKKSKKSKKDKHPMSPAKVRGAYSLAKLSSVTIENDIEITIKFKNELTTAEETKIFKAETAEDAERWRDAMKSRMSEMQTRRKYLLEWLTLPDQPRGLLCVDFDRTLLKEHTFQRANDLAVKGLEALDYEELLEWFGGQERLDLTKKWLSELWNKYQVAWVIISLGRTEQVMVICRRLGLLPEGGTMGLQGIVGSKKCVFGYDKGVSVQECCSRLWDRTWMWALRQTHRIQNLAVFFADDSKRNVDAVHKTCGLSDEQLMFVDKDKAIDQAARDVISTFFSQRLANVPKNLRLPMQLTLRLPYPAGGTIGLCLHTKVHKQFKDETYVQVIKFKDREDGTPGAAERAGIFVHDRIDCIDDHPMRTLRQVKQYLSQVHTKDKSRTYVMVVVLRLEEDFNRKGSRWCTR